MRALILTERIVVLFRLVKHCRIINKRDMVQPSSCSLILLKHDKPELTISLNCVDSEIIFSRLTNSKRESDQWSRRRYRAAIHSRPRRASFCEAEDRPNSTAMRSDCRDFGVCAKLARYTRVSLISSPRTKLSPWRRQWGESLTSQAQTLEMTNDRMYLKYTVTGVFYFPRFSSTLFLSYLVSAVAQSQHFNDTR